MAFTALAIRHSYADFYGIADDRLDDHPGAHEFNIHSPEAALWDFV